MIGTIAWRELRSLFLSPLAWVVLAVVQIILALVFLSLVDEYLNYQTGFLVMSGFVGFTETVVSGLFNSAAIVLLLVTPLLTMRLLAEERRNRTLPLLFSAPVSMTEIVLGKYLGALGFLLVVLAMIALMPLALYAGGRLDLGLLFSGLLGLTLLVGSFTAVGLFMSTLTQLPTVAAISTFGALLLFWILDWSGQGAAGRSVLAYLSLFNHYRPFLQGVFDTTDAVYHALLITTFLGLSVRRLDAARLGG